MNVTFAKRKAAHLCLLCEAPTDTKPDGSYYAYCPSCRERRKTTKRGCWGYGTGIAIIERLQAMYICKYCNDDCPVSSLAKICCHECDRQCRYVKCVNHPDKCGAEKRKRWSK